jgi:hypothetical protein
MRADAAPFVPKSATGNNNNNNNSVIEAALQRLGVRTDHNNVHDTTSNTSTMEDAAESMETMILSFQHLASIVSTLQYDVTTRMNHYSIIPPALQQLYDTMHHHTSLIHHTVTKYTLMQQMVVVRDSESTTNTTTTNNNNNITQHVAAMTSITKELLHSSQLLVACIIALYTNDHDDETKNNNNNTSIGASKSLCVHTKTAIHQIIHAMIQLLTATVASSSSGAAASTTSTSITTNTMDLAQQTGVVWEACQTILGDTTSTTTNNNHKKTTTRKMITTIPLGNRNAIRRDIFHYKLECQDTIQEFEVLLEQSQKYIQTIKKPHSNRSDSQKKHNVESSDDDDENDDDDDEEDFYTTQSEINIVTPCVALLKCSRGALNITLNMIDHIGMSMDHPNNDTPTLHTETSQKYIWIQHLCQEVHVIGRGLTELGATLYPPLLDENYTALVGMEVIKQSSTIQDLLQYMLDHIIDAPIVSSSSSSMIIPAATIDLIHSVLTACKKRTDEAMDAIGTPL